MKSRFGARVIIVGLLGATGCTGGDDLLLGQAELRSDAGSEQPMEEDAGGEAPAPTPDAGSARTCRGDLAGRPKVELFVRDIPELTCEAPPCEFQTHQLKVASDGSLWIAGSLHSIDNWLRGDLWIGHYSATGELLGSARTKRYGNAVMMTVDDQDRAWLLAGDPALAPTTILYRFDEKVREISKLELQTPHTDLIPYPQHGVLLSAPGRVLAAIGYDGRMLWSASDGRPGRLAVDNMGRIALATQETFDEGDGPESMRIDWFAEGGSPLPGRTPIQIDVPTNERSSGLFMTAQDELTTTYNVVPRPGGTATQRIERWDAQGTVKWRWELPGAPEQGVAIDPITGSILTMGLERGKGLALVAISPDGAQCRRFGIDGPAYGFLSLGPKGEIWFVANGPGGYQNRFGRMERPDLRW